MVLCLLAVFAFSLSLPATKVAAPLGGVFIGAGRAVVASLLAAIALKLSSPMPRPDHTLKRRLWVVAAGVVFGFPILTAIALRSVPAFHAVVVVGLAPLFTATFATVRARHAPPPSFWVLALVGATAVGTYGWLGGDGGSAHGFATADLLLVVAAALAGLGYAEGADLAREHGGLRVISLALVQSLPLTLLMTVGTIAWHGVPDVAPMAWVGFAYTAVVSMFGAFVAWYGGLSLGNTARLSQLQLVQPVLGVLWSAALLGETIGATTLITAGVVVSCAALASARPSRHSVSRARRQDRPGAEEAPA